MITLTLRSTLTAAGLCLSVILAGLSSAYAQVPKDDPFELDGNALDGAAAGFDWETFQTKPNTKKFIDDKFNDSTDDNFFKGGSKDERDISSAGVTQNYWLNTPTTPPDKDDIEHAFAVNTVVNGEQVIYFGADRLSNSGDAAIGFWFFKSKISEKADGTFSGVHSVGDVLVTSDFRQGGSASVINVFKWNGNPQSPLTLVASSTTGGGSTDANGVFCLTNLSACAAANSSPVGVPPTWSYYYKDSGVNQVTTYPTGTFFEGGINVKDLFGSNQCFASFLAMTRTSASTTAQLKDFALGDFPVCSVNVEKVCDVSAPPEVSADGSSVDSTFKVIITNDGGAPLADIRVKEDFTRGTEFPVAGDFCAITAINGNSVNAITLIDSTGTKGEVKVAESLVGEMTLTVECTTKMNGLQNQIEVIAGSSPGASDVKDLDIMTSAEVCRYTALPGIKVTKVCSATPPQVSMINGVKPEVCVDLTVENTSDEDLSSVTVIDPLLNNNSSILPASYQGVLERKSGVVNLGRWCYPPTTSDGDPPETDPNKITYTNTVTAEGYGVVSREKATNTTSATCNLCQ
ncbi:hypothetical protein [Vogesella indigofera]|uniref:hypothetical protein n=1 Tax=Vogesella indigofera TaxID=45465 RepID=UPI00234E8B43|nr:hypothetical protein [Vogesella indigofera]MDC7696299.1 hypothetical protein [Vogesella indigofera]